MKITIQIKLQPDEHQFRLLVQTLELTNKACNRLSQLAWETKTFNQLLLQKRFYRQIRDEYPLSAQVFIRAIAKVSQAYKITSHRQCIFRYRGAVAYDSRILSIYPERSELSIWCLQGREKMPFVCGEKQRKLLKLPLGESDLIYRNNNFYLNISVEI